MRQYSVERRYAGILQVFILISFAVLLVSFVIFAAEILPAQVATDDIPKLWGLSAEEYGDRTGFPENWAWLGSLGQGDVLTFAALALIAAATPICFLALTYLYLRSRDYPYAVMSFLVVLILVLAASGLVGVA